MLLVLVGGVMSANAWTTVKLYNSVEGAWSADQCNTIMTKIDDGSNNYFYYILDSSTVTDTNGNYYFRIWVSDNSTNYGSYQNDFEILDYVNYGGTASDNSFKLVTDKTSQYIISVGYWDNVWHFTATKYVVNADKITFVNSDIEGDIYAYAYCTGEAKLLGGWPGTKMTNNGDGTWSIDNVNIGNDTKFIFNNNNGTQYPSSNGYSYDEKCVYDKNGIAPDVNVSITNDYGTFASPYPLTFPENGEIYAYKASQVSGNKMIMERVIGTVPAKTGLFLEKNTAKTMTVSPCATTVVVSSNYLKAGGVSVTSDGTGDRYGFQTQSSGVGFYKITGNAVAVPENKAYLELPVGTVNAPSLSIEIDGETTGIKVINWEDVDANNDGQIYDLQGRRVYQPTTGIYIKNGKKVIVK